MWILGLVVGAAIGWYGSPLWEMAPLIIAPIAALVGAFSAFGASSGSKEGMKIAVAVTSIGSVVTCLLAHQNPIGIILHCTAIVFAAGVVCSGIGYAFRPNK